MTKSKIFRGIAIAVLMTFSLFLVCITTACDNAKAPVKPLPIEPEVVTPVYADKVISP